MSTAPVVVERLDTPRGELVLRYDGSNHEVISNGTFLMDTRDGRSERLLVSAALARHVGSAKLLIGGLGVGFSLIEAVADDRVREATVVEIEPAVIRWNRTRLGPLARAALDDPRTRIVVADFGEYLQATDERYDVICLDVDNGPDWIVTATNSSLYDNAGMALIAERLAPGGCLSVWSAARSPAYEDRLRRHFADVEVHEVPVPRGEPDVVITGTKAGPRCTTVAWHP